MAEQILELTLEIIYLLSGEDYTLVKRPEGRLTSSSGGRSNNQTPIMEPPPKSVLHLRDNEQKILEIINKILQLLTGEVPVRCEDVTVHLSMEEWEYLEGHKDQYKEVLTEEHQDLTPQDPNHSPDLRPHSEEGGRHGGQSITSILPSVTPIAPEKPPTKSQITERFPISEPKIKRLKNQKSFTGEGPFNLQDDELPIICKVEYNSDEEDFSVPSLPSPDLSSHPTQPEVTEQFPSLEPKTKLFKNQKSFTGERPFPCTECDKRFKAKAHLLSHMKLHTGDKPHRCLECGKRFSYKSQLIFHQKYHTGERPYPCPECGKCFISNAQMVSHLIIHTGERPYACSECEKRFAYKSNRDIHLRTHTGEKPFWCPECGKCFITNSKLIQHRKRSRSHVHKEGDSLPRSFRRRPSSPFPTDPSV